MGKLPAVVSCLALVLITTGFAQQKKAAPKPKPKSGLAAMLEAKVREAWADYQLKRKAAFAAFLTDDYIIVEEDGAGPRDKKSQLAEIDQFDLAQYFKVRPIAGESALVMYTAEYSGAAAGQSIREKVVVSEVWVRRSGAWKCMLAQMTRMT